MTSVFKHPWLSGVFGDPEVLAHLSADTQLAHMLRIEAAALAVEAAQITPQDLMAGASVDGLPVPELVRCLRAQISQELHTDIHQGLTSQDVIDTALVLFLRDVLSIFERRLAKLQSVISQLLQDHGTTPLMGWTRMQALAYNRSR